MRESWAVFSGPKTEPETIMKDPGSGSPGSSSGRGVRRPKGSTPRISSHKEVTSSSTLFTKEMSDAEDTKPSEIHWSFTKKVHFLIHALLVTIHDQFIMHAHSRGSKYVLNTGQLQTHCHLETID